MYSVFQIADAFIRLGIKNSKPLTHLQIQKLCFLAHGYYLAVREKPLFPEPVYAWPYGPVISELYTQLKRFGREKINTEEALYTSPLPSNDEDVNNLIQVIYDNYGHFTGGQLSSLTHQAGTPWANTWYEDKFSVISQESIKKYYKQLIGNK